MFYVCCDERRRAALKDHDTLNGIDFLEVLDDPALPADQRQRTLYVHFLNSLAPDALSAANLRIEGGERVRDIAVLAATIGADGPNVLTVQVSQPGDFSIYTLRLVQKVDTPAPPAGFDGLMSAVDFTFKVNCPSDFDCATAPSQPRAPGRGPDINYLARDYASLRRLMLDRMAALIPQWRERGPADSGIALVELLAYIGDHLSYQQDAVMTEGYFGTARRRISVRRHARLVDYAMHDGRNARAWVHIRVEADTALPRTYESGRPVQLLSGIAGMPGRIQPEQLDEDQALAAGAEIFELMHDIQLFQAHNQLRFYTWGARTCHLPAGATRATLQGDLPGLRPGMVLVFAEALGPRTGLPADADPARRHAVRLTEVIQAADPLGGRFADDPTDAATPVTEIIWHPVDALPFSFCVSATIEERYYEAVSVALGNIALVDHGLTIADEQLGSVPESQPGRPAPRFRPYLARAPLTYAAPYDERAPASASIHGPPAAARPALALRAELPAGSQEWRPLPDLLNSGPAAPEFVVEVEADATARLRFGDDRNGLRPARRTTFWATYRVGNGARGNVAAGAIAHIVTEKAAIVGVSNPLPARGGAALESVEELRQRAPAAFRTQERAVTAADYAAAAQRHPEVQRAAATFRWTGSWRTLFLTVDRVGGLPIDAAFETDVRRYMERFRMAGYDLEVDGPRFVPLEIALSVCVQRSYFRSAVKAALLDVFSARRRRDGQPGAFHPDNFTFGQPVYLSHIYAAAQAVAGVASVIVTTFRRQGSASLQELDAGKIELARLEIARLDNDPNYPERGVLRLTMEGGK
jgi:hypothetical protein